MKLFHWQFEDVDYLLCAESVDSARSALVTSLNGWKWQDPQRLTRHLEYISTNDPFYVADPLHVISIDKRDFQGCR